MTETTPTSGPAAAEPALDEGPDLAVAGGRTPPKRPRGGAIRSLGIGLVAVSAVAAGYLAHHALSTELYEGAYRELEQANAAVIANSADYQRSLRTSDVAAEQAEALEQVIVPGYAKPEDVEAFLAASDALGAALADAAPAEPGDIDTFTAPAALESAAWERYADAATMLDLASAREDEAAMFEDAADPLFEARAQNQAAVEALFAGAREVAAAELQANPSATNRTRIPVQRIIDDTRDDAGPPAHSATAFTALVQAVDALRASHAAEEARKLEPEYPMRAEIEAFARSIAGGVALDFVWAHHVNGLSSDGWYSGTAQFWPTDGGWAEINLTHSVSDHWADDPNARAVVVHEVGHTQVVRPLCEPLFTGPEFAGDHEMWATAWAIGMGHDLPGAGIEAYGRPSDAQIAVAAQCR
ncbi:hypothetical protein [Agromyces sp. Marseille-P2726]|uniref:hypothetical protein n=1 Tax=Agromyces sp. Marseille-P2726 TaxID=2709132 RepID=UPI00156DDFAF|nr:hypothetical protein [Agromyces sp. Marseille-P2726]